MGGATEMSERTGRCLCGAVTFSANPEAHVDACHCAMCRRWGGGPFLGVNCGPEVAFAGGRVTRHRSSDWAERGFCAACGTHLFYFFVPQPTYVLPAGLFDDQSGLTFEKEIYIDAKPGWYAFAGDRTRHTEAEFLQSMGIGEES
jgi:hypothetical protein